MSKGLPPLVLLGAGGHAKVVIDLIRAGNQYEIMGIVDTDPSPRSVLGAPVIGSDSALPGLRGQGVQHAFVAVGRNETRFRLAELVARNDFELVNAISPSAVIAPSVQLGHGIAAMAGVAVNAESAVSDLAIINTGASVDHDAYIGRCAHIGPGCTLAGNVRIGALAFLGVGVCVIPGVAVGERAVVGAGACVIRDVPSDALAKGVPARVVEHDS
jgi:UDP-perosamine 4-acetyltransferase